MSRAQEIGATGDLAKRMLSASRFGRKFAAVSDSAGIIARACAPAIANRPSGSMR